MVMTRHSDDDVSDPKDEDLDALFDRVWAGYSLDTSTKSDANESKLNGSKWSLNSAHISSSCAYLLDHLFFR